MIAAIAIVVLLLGQTEPGAPAPPSSAESDVLGFADYLLERGEPYRAIGEYERYLFSCGERCAKGMYAEMKIADALRRGGDPAGAATRLRRVLAAHPDAPEAAAARKALGEALESAGDPGGASDVYRHNPADSDLALRTALRAQDPERVRLSVPREDPARFEGLLREMRESRPSRRSPVAAGVLSAVLPGSGQLYVGRWRDGLMSFTMNALFISAAWIAWDHDQPAVAGTLAGLEVLWYGGNVVGAVNGARRFNRMHEGEHWRGLERRWLPGPTLSFRF